MDAYKEEPGNPKYAFKVLVTFLVSFLPFHQYFGC